MTGTGIVLASASQARSRMLEQAGIAIRRCPVVIDEAAVRTAMIAEGAGADEIAASLADMKAQRALPRAGEEAFIIAADQTLACAGRLLEKPANRDEAREQLLFLRGREHRLFSAVCLMRGGRFVWRHLDTARLTMRAFSDAFLEAYLDRADDALTTSVGAYRLEEVGAQLFARIDGDFFTILGLPLLPLLDILRENGVLRK